jgi:hypothetical protein
LEVLSDLEASPVSRGQRGLHLAFHLMTGTINEINYFVSKKIHRHVITMLYIEWQGFSPDTQYLGCASGKDLRKSGEKALGRIEMKRELAVTHCGSGIGCRHA